MNNIFMENDKWSCKVKKVDLKTYQLSYEIYDDFETREEAEAFSKICQRQFDKDFQKIKKTTTIRFTFSQYLDYYFTEVMPLYGKKSYLDKTKWVVEVVIKPNIDNDILLEFLTYDYLNKLLKNCSKLCKSAAPAARDYLSISLGYAYKEGYINNDIMENVDRYVDEKPDIVTCTKDEFKKLLIGAKKYNNGSIYCEILLAALAGLRSSESRGLSWSDIDFTDHTISIKRQAGYNSGEFNPPKTANSYRTIKVADLLIEELKVRKKYNECMYKKTQNKNFLEYVSVSDTGEIKSHGTYYAGLKKICKTNNLKQFSYHDLRHIFATIIIENTTVAEGEDPELRLRELSNMLGHKNIGTTLDIYVGDISAFEELRTHISEELNPTKVGV